MGMQWIWVSKLHRTLGVAAHLVALVASVLGVFSGWGVANLGGNGGAAAMALVLVVGEVAILMPVLSK